MWALIVDGSVNQVFRVPTAFKHPKTGIQYPRNWLNLATAQEKKDVGFIEVTISGAFKDNVYYLDQESSPVYDASKGTVTITRSAVATDVAVLQASFVSKASLLARTVPPVATKDLLTTLSLIGNPIFFCDLISNVLFFI